MDTMTYLTEAEEAAVFKSDLPSQPPFYIRWVTTTQFSIARHYGSCRFNAHSYTYFPATDELIRDDVLKFVTKMRKAKPDSKVENGKLDL